MKKHFTLFTLFLFLLTNIFAQRPGGNFGGSITGTVIDSVLQIPIEYANIILFSTHDENQIDGNVSGSDGIFKLNRIRPGSYYVEVSFIGYDKKKIESVEITSGSRTIDLGTIELVQTALRLGEAEIIADKPAIEYKIDKKVINVAEQYTTLSGTAVDVLENVPSITVDIEGNVMLRGSSSFTVLIDNRPSVLDPNDALQQLPASAIDNIEIITNPSAKFDPEGESGIINVILKKEKLSGTSGIVNSNVGLEETYGGDFLLSFRNSNYGINFGADFNQRNHPGTSLERRETYRNDTTTFINSDGSSKRGRNGWGIRGQFDYNLTANDLLGLSFRYGGRDGGSISSEEFNERTFPESFTNNYLSYSDRNRGGDFYSANLSLNHNFGKSGHDLLAQVDFRRRDSEEDNTTEIRAANGSITSGKKLTEDGPSDDLEFKIDYSNPLDDNNKIEAGFESESDKSTDINNSYEYVPSLGVYEIEPQFGYEVSYNRIIYAAYGIYSGQTGNLGYQGGLRTEYMDRSIIRLNSPDNFDIKRWDYFPTIHFSYKESDIQQVMVSYTRRIRRPRGYYLEPFEIRSDAYSVRRGNPNLKPQYIDSYEAGYQTFWENNLISFEAYYRKTLNNIERIRSLYDTTGSQFNFDDVGASNVTLLTFENVGTTHTLGGEFMLNTDILSFWGINFMGNIYNYKIVGTLNNRSIDRESFSWRIRLNNNFSFDKTTKLQINTMFNSRSVSAQGESKGNITTNVALRKDFFNRALSATLQIRDIFGSGERESTTTGLNFSSYNFSERKSPVFSLNLRFNFNNHKVERERDQGNEGDFEGDDEF